MLATWKLTQQQFLLQLRRRQDEQDSHCRQASLVNVFRTLKTAILWRG